jgi:hypothetical protein
MTMDNPESLNNPGGSAASADSPQAAAAPWHYARAGQSFGPVTEAQIHELAKTGQLHPSDLVWTAGMAQWTEAGRVKGLFPEAPSGSPPPLPLPGTAPAAQEVIPVAEDAGGTAARPAMDKAKEVASSLAQRGKAAARYVARQAERTKLVSMTLPAAYLALGRHVYSSGRSQAEFPDLHQKVAGFAGEIEGIESRAAAQPKAEGFIAKAKAAARTAQEMMQVQSLRVKGNRVLTELGKAAFEKIGPAAGPDELVRPIAEARDRVAALDAEG